ncbi:hypothetical protein [Halarchaeum nitratireducens]|uniref:Uncharacterized protein n=1 Tax=Halarchaeum nitratireducens TaxID=489913 RepID=A0A830GCF6_9EURY|nr:MULTISPECIES: hypothetical protein [Halarchaeum]MBP2250973.1 hypothetical protein [Halarchaeum solikamskense]GGN21434.1 hypothetical protein GCM10009021_23380 [Halarchaeum nitratireducens]
MTARLALPTGETVTPEDVFCYGGYPYRFRPLPGDEYAFALSPLYWGESDMDVPFPDEAALEARWEGSRGVLSDDEWRAWLADARDDERFGDDELDAIAVELGLADDSDAAPASPASLTDRVRDTLGL